MGILDKDAAQLQQEVLRLRRRLEIMTTLYRLLLVVVRILGRLDGRRVSDKSCKLLILRAVTRARSALPLRSALRVLGLSESRYHSWVREARGCKRRDESCSRRSPNRLTPDEVCRLLTEAGFGDLEALPCYPDHFVLRAFRR